MARSGEPMTSERRLKAADKQRQALELRKAGLDFRTIADRLGYKSVASAHDAVRLGLKHTLQEPADELRTLEVKRLDAMLLGLWPQATRGMYDAVDRVLKIMARRAALLGLDAPKKVENTGKDGGPIQVEGIGPDLSAVLTLEQRFALDQIFAEAEEVGR